MYNDNIQNKFNTYPANGRKTPKSSTYALALASVYADERDTPKQFQPYRDDWQRSVKVIKQPKAEVKPKLVGLYYVKNGKPLLVEYYTVKEAYGFLMSNKVDSYTLVVDGRVIAKG